jgi:5-methylcytosine-specific restriction endonuclease McrA
MGEFGALLALLALPLLGLLAVGGPPALVPRQWREAYRHRQRLTWRGLRRVQRGRQASGRVPDALRAKVARACRNRCVACGRHGVQADHIIPWDAGGLTRFCNLAGLCWLCNKVKSDYFNGPGGRTRYRAWAGFDRRSRARRILAKERAHRWNPLRYVRAM